MPRPADMRNRFAVHRPSRHFTGLFCPFTERRSRSAFAFVNSAPMSRRFSVLLLTSFPFLDHNCRSPNPTPPRSSAGSPSSPASSPPASSPEPCSTLSTSSAPPAPPPTSTARSKPSQASSSPARAMHSSCAAATALRPLLSSTACATPTRTASKRLRDLAL